MRKVTPGWRYCECECGYRFREATRDWQSPSLTVCPKCHDEVGPDYGEEDLTLVVDKCGNLLESKVESQVEEKGYWMLQVGEKTVYVTLPNDMFPDVKGEYIVYFSTRAKAHKYVGLRPPVDDLELSFVDMSGFMARAVLWAFDKHLDGLILNPGSTWKLVTAEAIKESQTWLPKEV